MPDDWWGVFAVWEGGLGVWGGIGLGTIVGAIIVRRSGESVIRFMDAVAPGLLLAQAIGRWGNWWNQELFGGPTDLPWGLQIDPQRRPLEYVDVELFHPTFLYESLYALVGVGILLLVDRFFRIRPPGLFALYVAFYSVGRFFIELLRVDPIDGREEGSNRIIASSHYWATWESVFFIKKAIEKSRLVTELSELRQQLSDDEDRAVWGNSEKMRGIATVIEQVSDSDVTVLLRGESGVGKELVARAIHQRANRRNRPFVKVNCAALPAELLESELFGHEKGAFTGAATTRIGKFEQAHSGTIFLDEIGEMKPPLQAKLLHVLQDGEFSRVGGEQVAIFRVGDNVYAVGNKDPFSGANVLSRGIVGDLKGGLVVASPVYKQHFSLASGVCLEDPAVRVAVFEVRLEGDKVMVRAVPSLPPSMGA